VIEVGEEATAADLRAVLPVALAYRDRLTEIQGPWLFGGPNALFEELLVRRQYGEGPATLAREVNATLAEHLRACLLPFEGGEGYASVNPAMARVAVKITGNREWLELPNPFEWEHAMFLATCFLPGEEAVVELQAALDNVRQGKAAFPPDCPVTPERLRQSLKTWRDGPLRRGLRRGEKSPTSKPSR